MKKLNEVVENTCRDNGVDVATAKKIAKELSENIADEIVDGGIDMYGICKFEVVDTKERQGRNPSSGEAITIKANKAIKAKVSGALKKLVKI